MSKPETESFADDAPLMALFGSPATAKLISVFVAERGRDLTVSELARQAGVARSTVYDHLDDLVELGAIEHTRDTRGGHSKRYQLNEDDELGERLYELEGVVLRRLLENRDDVDP